MGLFENFSNAIDKVSDAYDTVSETYKRVDPNVDRVLGAAKEVRDDIVWRKSDERIKANREADRYLNKSKRLTQVFLIIWIVLIVITIVLCLRGDDIILRLINL